MPTLSVPKSFLISILENEENEDIPCSEGSRHVYPVLSIERENSVSSDFNIPDRDLHDQYRLVFAYQGEIWECKFHRMTDYYRQAVGEDCEPFEYQKGDTIICQKMKRVVTYTYLPDWD